MNTSGERIRWALSKRGNTATWLARQLGITRAAVALWWSRRKPTSPYKHVERISEILEVRLEWLLTGRGEPMPARQDNAACRGATLFTGEMLFIASIEVTQQRACVEAEAGSFFGSDANTNSGHDIADACTIDFIGHICFRRS